MSVKDYLTCEKVWDKFEMKNMSDYHNHYLKNDVLLSADVFEKFIDTCLRQNEYFLLLNLKGKILKNFT